MSEFSGKTVLITGATGLIGSNLVDRFMSMGDVKVIALGRNGEKLKYVFNNYLGNSDFTILQQDICSEIALKEKVDYIFNAAGSMTRTVINNKPLDVIGANLLGVKNCVDFLNRQENNGHAGRIIIFSSVTVYGNETNTDKTVKEDDTTVAIRLNEPYAAYAEAKRMSEVLALSYCRQRGIDVVVARLSTVYGYAKCVPDSAFYEFISQALHNSDIHLKSSGLAKRDNIYIDDAVEGLLTVCAKGIRGEAYNISSNGELGNYASVDEIAEMIADIANRKYGKDVTVIYESGHNVNRAAGIKLDNCKLKGIGKNIRVSLHDGLEKTLARFVLDI